MTRYKSVLLIDDNELDILVNNKIIENAGFAEGTASFNSAQDALNMFKSTEVNALPDLIFLDIMMPVMDGFAFLDEFAKLSQEVKKKCKIIMLSTSDSF